MTVATRLRVGGFAPNRLAGLVLWLDADRITGLTDGAAVATWPDVSGLGNDATQATSGNRPTYETNEVNGHPALRFVRASSHHLRVDSLASVFSGTDRPCTVVAVHKVVDNTENFCFFGAAQTVSGSPFLYCTVSFGAYQANKRDDANTFEGVTTSFGVADIFWHVVSTVIPGTTAGIWRDGTNLVAGGSAFNVGAATIDNVAVGAVCIGGGPAAAFKGDIAELLVYDRALDVPERQQLERHLGAKYGITVI